MTVPLTPINQFRLGSFKFTVVRDGTNIMERPWETFGIDQSPDTIRERLADNFLPTDRLLNGYTPAIIETGSDLIAVDTGLGAAARGRSGGMLVPGLIAAGYRPEQVTLVILTHMHGDHIGGTMENGVPAFPNARYVAGRIEYDFWTDTARVGTPAEGGHNLTMSNVAPFSEKLSLARDGDEVAPGITAILAPGHTPGHMAFHVESNGVRLLLTGDAANHYILSLEQPDWEVRFDLDKAEAARTRRRLFDMIATERIAFLGYHMPFPAVGFVEKHGTGFRYVPKSYQFDF
jgi:glyoxylase-like metal-dependent hydrolase (beta-lactamase superfamily II)